MYVRSSKSALSCVLHHSAALDTYTKITIPAYQVKNVSKAKQTEAPLKAPIKSDFSLATE